MARGKGNRVSGAEQVLTHDLEQEASVLGTCLYDTDSREQALEYLRPEHFYSEAHRRILEAVLELVGTGKPVDSVSVAEKLVQMGRLAQVGGLDYLAEVAARPAVSVKYHGRAIYDKWKLRQLISGCERVAAEARTHGDVQQATSDIEQYILAVTKQGDTHGGVTIQTACAEVWAKLRPDSTIKTVSTGFPGIDEVTGGLFDGEVTIVAARPGMGKTAFVSAVLMGAAKAGTECLFFSVEMPRNQIALRAMCAEAKVDVLRARVPSQLTPKEYDSLAATSGLLQQLPLWIDDTGGLPINELMARAKRAAVHSAKNGKRLGLVAVDYLQLLRPAKAHGNREQEVSEISNGLKALAKDLSVPVIALAQLNRAVELREDKRPHLSDLRDSGGIEQDADNVFFLYRDGYYDRSLSGENKEHTELIIAKQRNGPLTWVPLVFKDYCVRYENSNYGR